MILILLLTFLWSNSLNFGQVPGTHNFAFVHTSGCIAGQYLSGSCINVGLNYYSPADDDNRYACPSYSTTVSATDSDEVTDCLCGIGRYMPSATCDDAGFGYISYINDNGRLVCGANTYTMTANSDGEEDCLSIGGYYDPDTNGFTAASVAGSGYFSGTGDETRTACGGNTYTATTTSDGEEDCLSNAGYYDHDNDGTTAAVNVGVGYYSPAGTETRLNCPLNSSTSGANSSLLSECLGDVDYYDCADGSCDAVGSDYYSPALSNSRIACSNLPANASSTTYSGSGGGINNCPYGTITCNAGYTQSGQSCVANVDCSTLNSSFLCTGSSSSGVLGTGLSDAACATACSNHAGLTVGCCENNSSNQCQFYSGETTVATSTGGSAAWVCGAVACGVDQYWDGSSCIAVGNGYYSAASDPSRTACTNLPANASSTTYSSSGGGSNNCTYDTITCNSGYTQSGQTCAANVSCGTLNTSFLCTGTHTSGDLSVGSLAACASACSDFAGLTTGCCEYTSTGACYFSSGATTTATTTGGSGSGAWTCN